MDDIKVLTEGKFSYITSGGDGEKLILLHGLFGALSNFKDLFDEFSKDYEVMVPLLPIYQLPIFSTSLEGLLEYVQDFIAYKDIEKAHILGNSLGGHVAILYVLDNPQKTLSLTLTGSSGLFESAMGNTFPKRGDYEYIKKKTEDTFYDPKTATKELVDEVFSIVNDKGRVIRIIAMAKSAIRHNVADKLHHITCPTLLIWGAEDKVTPPFVGRKFNELMPKSKLFFLEKTGHAPMMEHPEAFNGILHQFLNEVATGTFIPEKYPA
jgi:pimeloyl-ACP methyl ester carboxylesterase